MMNKFVVIWIILSLSCCSQGRECLEGDSFFLLRKEIEMNTFMKEVDGRRATVFLKGSMDRGEVTLFIGNCQVLPLPEDTLACTFDNPIPTFVYLDRDADFSNDLQFNESVYEPMIQELGDDVIDHSRRCKHIKTWVIRSGELVDL